MIIISEVTGIQSIKINRPKSTLSVLHESTIIIFVQCTTSLTESKTVSVQCTSHSTFQDTIQRLEWTKIDSYHHIVWSVVLLCENINSFIEKRTFWSV